MAKRLERTPIPRPELSLFPESSSALTPETIKRINAAIRTRRIPFTDDITNAEKVGNLESFRYGVQRRGTKNMDIGNRTERALHIGAVGRAGIYRLLELSLMHGAIAAENYLAVQSLQHAIRGGYQASPDVVGRSADAGQDLAHGLQRQRFFETPLGKNLPGVVLEMSESLRITQSPADLPFIGMVANDTISKRNFWAESYRRIQGESGQVIKPDRVAELFHDPARVEQLLRVHIPHGTANPVADN